MKTKNKIISIFLILFLSILSINAVSLETNQDITEQRYQEADLSVINSFTIFGNDNLNYSVNNNTYTYDIRNFVNYLDTDYYLTYNNQHINDTIEVHLTTIPETGLPIITTYKVNMYSLGDYHFLIKPSYTGENLKIEINAPDSFGGDIYFTTTKNKYIENIDSITGSFVGAAKDLIDVNIGVWKIFYYVLVISLIIGSIGLLIGFSFRVYEWADDLSTKKNKIFRGGK